MTDTNTAVADTQGNDLVGFTAQVVAAFVGNSSNLNADDVPNIISQVHSSFVGLSGMSSEQEKPEPAVAIRSSVKKDHIVCLEDGKKMKMLKRYLRTHYNMSPDEYRAKWGLPADYPMVAPDYAEKRRDLAKKIGLGRKPGQKVARKKASTAKTAAKK